VKTSPSKSRRQRKYGDVASVTSRLAIARPPDGPSPCRPTAWIYDRVVSALEYIAGMLERTFQEEVPRPCTQQNKPIARIPQKKKKQKEPTRGNTRRPEKVEAWKNKYYMSYGRHGKRPPNKMR
jgi:hypothetical protein